MRAWHSCVNLNGDGAVLDNLLESRATSNRNIGGQFFSVALHTSAIAIAIFATERVVKAAPAPENEHIEMFNPPPPPPKPLDPLPRSVTAIPPVVFGHQIVIAPIDIPDVLPPIDLTRPITDEGNYTGKGATGGMPNGDTASGARPRGIEGTYFASQVEKQVVQISGTGTPNYPEALRAAGITGEVDVQFVVDTTGRAEMGSLKILKSSHPLFSESVRKALSQMRFKPAEAGSRKVRQLVEMPFGFSIKQ